MAFNSVLRRASKSLLPLAIRAVGTPRTFHRAIPAVLSVENLRDFLPSSHFSTAATALKPTADENLIRVLGTEIECVEEPHDVSFFPHFFELYSPIYFIFLFAYFMFDSYLMV
jgi:complement component 1 Q subcomponent-binding protein